MKLNLNSKKLFFSRLLNSITNFIISLKPQHGFISEIIHPIPIEIQEKMKQYTWKSNCPVPLEDLSYLKLTYWGFDNKTHTNGELIIHKDKALEVITIFKALYEMEYPIDRMELIEKYQGDDESSMMMNNTSSFNCRLVTGSKDKWSYHSYGTAIDINPLLNPYVKDNIILPKNAVPFVDRTKFYPGKITKGDSVYKLFIKHGWIWGGDWEDRKDYQHFATME